METKRVTIDFSDRAGISYSDMVIEESLNGIEKIFEECNEILSGAQMQECEYESQKTGIGAVAGGIRVIQSYVVSVHPYVQEKLDGPLVKYYEENVTSAFNNIVLTDLTTEMATEFLAPSITSLDGIEQYIPIEGATTLSLEDFVDVTECVGIADVGSVETVQAMK